MGARSGFFQLIFAFEELKSTATLNLISIPIPSGATSGNTLKLMLQKREGKYTPDG